MYKGFLDGYASVADIFGIRKTKQCVNDISKDTENLRKDWESVERALEDVRKGNIYTAEEAWKILDV